MKIRRLTKQDVDALLDLYRHLHEKDDPTPSRPVVEAVWEEISGADHFRYFGVFENGLLVSSCALSVIPNFTRRCRPYGVIENVVTHADYRNNGYGKRVLGAALENAWIADCYKVLLSTGRKDEQTLRFYESVGFDRHSKQAFVAMPPKQQR